MCCSGVFGLVLVWMMFRCNGILFRCFSVSLGGRLLLVWIGLLLLGRLDFFWMVLCRVMLCFSWFSVCSSVVFCLVLFFRCVLVWVMLFRLC